MRNGVSYVRMRNAAKQRPLLSVFLGTFLTISAIPLAVFFMVVIGSLSVGVVTFTAIQGGIILMAFAMLCACLFLPLILSGIFAFLAFCGLAVARPFVRKSEKGQPSGILSTLTRRISSLSNGLQFGAYLSNHGRVGGGRLVQVVHDFLGNRAIGPTHINQSEARSSPREPTRLVRLVQLVDSNNDGSFPVFSRPLMDRHEPSFDFLTAPSRATYFDRSYME